MMPSFDESAALLSAPFTEIEINVNNSKKGTVWTCTVVYCEFLFILTSCA